jgi:hypothetical protein
MKPGIIAYYHDPLNRLNWYKVYEGGGWVFYDVYHDGEHVGALLFGRERDGKRYYRALNYVRGWTLRCKNLRRVEMALAAPFLNPDC